MSSRLCASKKTSVPALARAGACGAVVLAVAQELNVSGSRAISFDGPLPNTHTLTLNG